MQKEILKATKEKLTKLCQAANLSPAMVDKMRREYHELINTSYQQGLFDCYLRAGDVIEALERIFQLCQKAKLSIDAAHEFVTFGLSYMDTANQAGFHDRNAPLDEDGEPITGSASKRAGARVKG